jgi:hypothetical protein
MDSYEVRIRAMEAARAAVGLSANPTGGNREAYLDFIAPGETLDTQEAMAKMSGCGLTVAGIWRSIRVSHPKLSSPYKVGEGISRLIQIARSSNAWRPFKAGKVPQGGDMVLVGDNQTKGIEHVYTVIEQVDQNPYDDNPLTLFRTVDGGQVSPEGYQIVLEKQHRWEKDVDFGLASTDPGSKVTRGRTIIGWVDVTALTIV